MEYSEKLRNFNKHLGKQAIYILDNYNKEGFNMPKIKIEVAGESVEIEMHADAFLRLSTLIGTEVKEYEEMMKDAKS